MPVYTVNVVNRPRPTRTITRRRLTGRVRQVAKAARRYLQLVMNQESRTAANPNPITNEKLIFRNDSRALNRAQRVIDDLSEALDDQLKIVKG